MRLSKKVDIANGKHVIIREMTIEKLRQFLKDFPDSDLNQMSTYELITKRLDDALTVLGDCIELPENIQAQDLTCSEATAVAATFIELHRVFFPKRKAGAQPVRTSAEDWK